MANNIPVTKHLSHDPAQGFSHHAVNIASDREPYGPPGLRGGLLFGYDQSVVSVILVMDQFLARFPRIERDLSRLGLCEGIAAYGYPMLTVAQLIGGVGISMLSMVAPLYISEISMSAGLLSLSLSLSVFLSFLDCTYDIDYDYLLSPAVPPE
ncbi:General substrate transporter [Penicillium paradoxum]|uniref:General substrate transporter n=1 Tax=Penicillium paradoxum TaxID=176176 RepID=UPI002547CF4A|nr:General substrate transporter [Penicillium paradoxum]KAJ5779093.1 General substrate transporter [Penicillium paradoxum]